MKFLKLLKPLDMIIILILTLLLIYDYFPNILLAYIIPKSILIVFILVIYLFSLLYKKRTNINDKEIFAWQVFSTIYILFLMSLFNILGGKSSVGLSFNNGGLWVILIFSIFEIFKQWKNIKQIH